MCSRSVWLKIVWESPLGSSKQGGLHHITSFITQQAAVLSRLHAPSKTHNSIFLSHVPLKVSIFPKCFEVTRIIHDQTSRKCWNISRLLLFVIRVKSRTFKWRIKARKLCLFFLDTIHEKHYQKSFLQTFLFSCFSPHWTNKNSEENTVNVSSSKGNLVFLWLHWF